MKIVPLLSLSLVVGLGSLPPAEAQEAGRGTRIEQGFAALDADKDGKLSTTEFAAIKATTKYFRENPEAIEPAFKRLDADSDSALTLEEFRKILQPRRPKPAGDGAPAKPEAPVKPSAHTAPAASAADIAFFGKSIHDWHATILHLLGLEHTKLTYRYAGRDMRLTEVKGNVVKGILA